jgi:hypothetical protein
MPSRIVSMGRKASGGPSTFESDLHLTQPSQREVCSREDFLVLSVLVALCRATALADQEADAFARRVYAVTNAGDLAGYEQLMPPQCHVGAVTSHSFELRSNLLNRLSPGASVEAMPLADYESMMRKRGGPSRPLVYKVPPSHVVVVLGALRGVANGDHVQLNPIVHLAEGWKLLDGDCVSSGP